MAVSRERKKEKSDPKFQQKNNGALAAWPPNILEITLQNMHFVNNPVSL